jgi:hypothetical protein
MKDVLLKLNAKEVVAFRRLSACKVACQQLIKHVVREYEEAVTLEWELWAGMRKKYPAIFADGEIAIQDDANGTYLVRAEDTSRGRSDLNIKEYVDQMLSDVDTHVELDKFHGKVKETADLIAKTLNTDKKPSDQE